MASATQPYSLLHAHVLARVPLRLRCFRGNIPTLEIAIQKRQSLLGRHARHRLKFLQSLFPPINKGSRSLVHSVASLLPAENPPLMRALVCNQYGPFDTLVIEDVSDPVPGDGEILFDVRAAALNFADLLSIAGKYQVRTPPPFVPGNEAAGIVTAVGKHVTGFRPGDRVIGALRGGAFAEQAVVDERYALPIPDGLDFEQAAAYSVAYGTSFHALQQAGLRHGERVLVLGAAGGVGYAAVELAKAMGAIVFAAASTREKLHFALEAGAEHGINYSEERLRETIGKLSGGQGIDVIYDPVGGELAEQAMRAIAWHGRYLVVGFASGEIPRMPLNLALLKEASIIGTWYGTWAANHPDGFRENARELASMVESGAIRPRCSAAFDLENFVEAFHLLAGRRAFGKIVLRMSND